MKKNASVKLMTVLPKNHDAIFVMVEDPDKETQAGFPSHVFTDSFYSEEN